MSAGPFEILAGAVPLLVSGFLALVICDGYWHRNQGMHPRWLRWIFAYPLILFGVVGVGWAIVLMIGLLLKQ